ALMLQLFGTSELLSRIGVIGSLAILPVTLGAGSLAMWIAPTLASASMVKGADVLFRYSINDATTQILYLPVAPHARVSSKAFIEGVVKPSAIGLCGLGLLAYRHWVGTNLLHLAWFGLLLCVIWSAIVASLRSRYVQSLEANLRHRPLDLRIGALRRDASAHDVLLRALQSPDPHEVLHALELLPQ